MVKNCEKLWKIVKNGEKWWKMVKNCEKLWKMVKNGEKWWKMVKNGEKWWKMVKNGEKLWKIVKNCEKLWKMVKNGEKWWKMVKNGEKWWKMVKNCEKLWKMTSSLASQTLEPSCAHVPGMPPASVLKSSSSARRAVHCSAMAGSRRSSCGRNQTKSRRNFRQIKAPGMLNQDYSEAIRNKIRSPDHPISASKVRLAFILGILDVKLRSLTNWRSFNPSAATTYYILQFALRLVPKYHTKQIGTWHDLEWQVRANRGGLFQSKKACRAK